MSDSIYNHVDFTNGSNWMSILIVYLYQRIVIRNFVYDRPCWVRIDVILLKLRDILLSRFISVLCIICLINDNEWILLLFIQNISFYNFSNLIGFYCILLYLHQFVIIWDSSNNRTRGIMVNKTISQLWHIFQRSCVLCRV